MASNDERLPRTITLGSAVLVGDAAACAHPLSASGITYAIQDGRILGEILRKTGFDVQTSLPQFARVRRPAQLTRLSLASALYHAFSARTPDMQALRAGTLRLLEPELRRAQEHGAPVRQGDADVAHGP